MQHAQLMRASDLTAIRAALLDERGLPRLLPAATVQAFPREQVLQLMVTEGLYVWPTRELAEWLANELGALDQAMEIGAGNGVLADHLGVRAVDNYSQSPDYKPAGRYRAIWLQAQAMYKATGQALVRYGANVMRVEATEAIKRFKPKVVYGCFITHRWREGDTDGNVFGVDEHKLLSRVERYLMVGNLYTHRNKRLLADTEYRLHQFPWLITRGQRPELDGIFDFRR